MEGYKSVVVSRVYRISDAEIEVRKTLNESSNDTAKRIALQVMAEELRLGILEANNDDFSIQVINNKK